MTTDDIRIGTDEGDPCNRLGCDGVMFFDYDADESTIVCPICGYGPDDEMEVPHDD